MTTIPFFYIVYRNFEYYAAYVYQTDADHACVKLRREEPCTNYTVKRKLRSEVEHLFNL